MRITFLCQHFPPETGAPQIRIYELSQELIRNGHQVEVLTAFPHHPTGIIPEEYRGKFYQYEIYDGIPVHRSWIYPSEKGRFWKRLASYFSFTFSSFYSIYKSKSTDVIICNSPPLFLGITAYIGAKLKGAKFVFNVADLWPESAVKLGILKNKQFIKMAEVLELFLYKKSWKIAAATDGIAEYVTNLGKSSKDVFVLPNGVNTNQFCPLPKDENLISDLGLQGKKVFTYAGNMGYAQGLDSVLRAAKLVQEKNDNVHFLFVGNGPEKEGLIKLSEELGLNNFTFYGSVPVAEMPRMFSISDYSIVPLKDLEIFKGARPSKIFPALATGTPVLYCGAGESADIITENNCGEVAIPENEQSIAEKIFYLANLDESDYETLSNNGRQLVLQEYSWSKIAADMLNHIDTQKERMFG
ncbi:MAG: glycosyl transferase group 1 [Bacillales bacterium]|jgi:glycosyltransferase involved in cell wall biosynthesis|nr:glycosyl transferase group 1 [Bacillales bacterium]